MNRTSSLAPSPSPSRSRPLPGVTLRSSVCWQPQPGALLQPPLGSPMAAGACRRPQGSPAQAAPDSALRILQLLLRCGMICREELDIVLDMTGRPPRPAQPGRERAGSRSGQGALLFEFD